MCVVMYSRHENFELSIVKYTQHQKKTHTEKFVHFFQNIASVKTILLIHGVVLATYMFHCLLQDLDARHAQSVGSDSGFLELEGVHI